MIQRSVDATNLRLSLPRHKYLTSFIRLNATELAGSIDTLELNLLFDEVFLKCCHLVLALRVRFEREVRTSVKLVLILSLKLRHVCD